MMLFPNTTITDTEVRGWPCADEISTHYGIADELHPVGHAGLDIAAAAFTEVFAPCRLRCTYNGYDDIFGWSVVGTDDNGHHHRFAHFVRQSALLVGMTAAPGTLIGRVGSTGYSTGPHLHWGISKPDNPWQNFDPQAGPVGVLVDPAEYVKEHSVEQRPVSVEALGQIAADLVYGVKAGTVDLIEHGPSPARPGWSRLVVDYKP